MGLLPDYSRQARTYDSTRGASPSVLAPLVQALAGAPGTKLVDIGGGTGNYAAALREEGFDPLVLDRSPEMLAAAADKGLSTLLADATALPLADDSFDAATLVAVLHHVRDQRAALTEARRILRPGGRLAAMVFTREDLATTWCLDYFPSSRSWMLETHLPLAAMLAELPGAQTIPVRYRDTCDGSLAALLAHPELVLEERWRAQTSYFERMERDHPAELRAGLERLDADVTAGRAPHEAGGATILAWARA